MIRGKGVLLCINISLCVAYVARCIGYHSDGCSKLHSRTIGRVLFMWTYVHASHVLA